MMKKIVSLMVVLMLCVAMACPVFADTFVPSIGYKDGPDIDDAILEEEDVSLCLIVTSITEAKEKTTDITQEARDLLLDVYDKLSDGSMKLPLEDGYVIRELVDVSFAQGGCQEPGHGHKELLAEDNTSVTVKFDMGIEAGTEVLVFTYKAAGWIQVENVTNNGDGTVTCEFEDLCPVAFCVEDSAEPPYTGLTADRNLVLWVGVMVVSLGAVVVLLTQRRKQAR